VCEAPERAPEEFRQDLARLLNKSGRSEEWARQVYPHAREAAPEKERPAIGQARDALRVPAEFPEAREPDPDLPADEWDEPEAAFRISAAADAEEEEGPEDRASLLADRRAARPYLSWFAKAMGSAAGAALPAIHRLSVALAQAIRFGYRLPGLRYALGVLLIAGVGVGGLWLAIDALDLFDRTAPEPAGAATSAPAADPAPDPFTLQVAAYLKPEHALKRVEELKNKGLDAYWTETSSGGKTWYQVRISHFPDQQSAREYGRKLKGKGLIDDFYVTSYVR
jgi:hypothetical protein